MKALMMVLLSTLLLPEPVNALTRLPASERQTKLPSEVKNGGAVLPCQETAEKVAAFLDEEGWGKVDGYTPKTVSGTKEEQNFYNFKVKVTNGSDSVSGFTYAIEIERDAKSEACIVVSVNTRD